VSFGALTYDADYYLEHLQQVGSGSKKYDTLYLILDEWAGVLEDWTLDGGDTITFDNGLTIDNATNNVMEWNENSDELKWTFGSNTIALSSTDVTTFSFGTLVVDLDQLKVASTTYTLPATDSTGTQYLASNGSGVLSWGSPSSTFTGGNITADCTLNADGIDILADTTTAHTYSIGVYDIDGVAYTDVLRWTNGDVPDIAVGSDTSSFALNSTTIDIAAGAISGVTTISTSGTATIGGDATITGALSAGSWNIGSGAFTATGAVTLGDNTSTVVINSTAFDVTAGGAVSGVTTLGMSGDLTNSGGDILLSNGKGVKASTTTAQSVGVYGYDTDGAYVGALVITNSATPATVLGNANGTTAIASSDWAISTTGAMTGIDELTISNATPSINLNDSDATDGDDNVILAVNATDTGSGSEDVDLTIAQQIAGTSRTVATFDADGNITFGYGTQNLVSTADVVVTGSDLTLGTAGVKLTGDGDGAITFLSLGDGSTEDLTINLDDTANTAVFSSTTGVDTFTFTGIGIDTDTVDVTSATPQITLKDTDAAAGDDNFYILAAATDTGAGTEDIDVSLFQQVAGADHDFIVSDADGHLTLDSGAGNIVMTDTVTFTGGQTKMVMFDPKVVALDGTAPPTLGDIGTDGQTQISALKFDADGGATGDDVAYISWKVPDGYVTDSARLNVCYTFGAAEDAADEAQFDFTVNAVAAGEALDAAGTALADQATVIADASTGEGKLYITQYNIEVETIAVDDLVTIEIAVDESESALSASGTLDVLYFEIEYESTE